MTHFMTSVVDPREARGIVMLRVFRTTAIAAMVVCATPASAQDGRGMKSSRSSLTSVRAAAPAYESVLEPAAATVLTEAIATTQPARTSVDPTAAILVAQAPENAAVWLQGKLMPQTGTRREYRSPALDVGKKYIYTVHAAWIENGKLVSHTQQFTVRAGALVSANLTRASSEIVQASTAAVSFATPSFDTGSAIELRPSAPAVLPITVKPAAKANGLPSKSPSAFGR
jgi:uncharacterized protein (TIGR03000 family)